MSGRHARPRVRRLGRGKIVALLSALLVTLTLVMPLPEQTDASWTDGESTRGTVTALILNPILTPVTCTDIPVPLLPTAARISWQAPQKMPAGAEYELVITKGSQFAKVYQTETSRRFEVSLLSDLLGFLVGSSGTITVQIRAVIRDSHGVVVWNAPSYVTRTVKYTAPVLGLLLGGFKCS